MFKSLPEPGSQKTSQTGKSVFIVEPPIPRSGGFNTPQLAAEPVFKACFGVHTRDFFWLTVYLKDSAKY